MTLTIKRVSVIMLFCFVLQTYGQELHIGPGGSITVASGSVLYISDNVSINTMGSLAIKSDATSSGALLTEGSVTGNITYDRYIPDGDWHLISAPVIGQSIPNFVADANNGIRTNGANGNYAVAYYNNSNIVGERWTYHNDTPTQVNQQTLINFNIGEGYSTSRTTGGDFSFTGELATSDVVVSLITSSGTHYWSSVGNPYPAFLPANDNANATNVLGQNIGALDPSFAALYVWDGSVYQPINQLSNALHLTPGQGFMVRAKDESENFTFSENIRSHQNGTATFYRTGNMIPSIEVHMSNGNESKMTTLKYLSNATAGLDVGYDAGTFENSTASFSIDTHLVNDSQGINFTLQCLPDDSYETMIVPLSVNATVNQELTFSAATLNLPAEIGIYIEDRVTNVFEEITDQSYQVTLQSTIEGIGRFYLHTSQDALSIGDITSAERIKIYEILNDQIRITGLQEQGKATVVLYTVTGRKVLSISFDIQSINDIQLPLKIATGLYLANIKTDQGSFTKKIVLE